MQPHLPHHIVSSFLTMISVNEIIMEVGRLRIKRYGQVEQWSCYIDKNNET